jgi:signal transduction histidine kinase
LIAVQKETLDNLTEGVVVYGGDGRLKLSNPAFLSQWQLNPEETEGQPHITKLATRMCQLFDRDQQEEKKEKLISHALERKIQEGRVAKADGTLLEFTTVPLPDGGVLVSYFDITDSVKVENALRERNKALEEAEQIKTDFLANVSYQLRTPLNAIMGFAEILNNQYFGELNNKQREYTTDIQNAGEKLVRLIDDILDLSTIEAGYLDLNMTSFNIKDTLVGLYDICQQWAQKENIITQLDCPDDIGMLVADERRLKQILLNLIHNAISFTPEKGAINLIARRDKDYVHFTVSDTGIGISKQDLERVFEPFERILSEQRADMSANALSRGAGLGLSLVKNIAELHDGKVDIESKENKGTSVTVSLPVVPIQEPDL